MNKKILYSILLGAVLVLPSMASAITVQGIVDGAVKTTIYVAGGVVVILWVVTGILFLTAQGDPSKLKAGKTALIAAIAGTILIIIAQGAVDFVTSIIS